ncbi:hypothetical protein ABZ679_29835, partial [Streptomyces fimicarius]
VADVECGHVQPFLPLVNGARARVVHTSTRSEPGRMRWVICSTPCSDDEDHPTTQIFIPDKQGALPHT